MSNLTPALNLDATEFIFSSPEDHVRHALYRQDGLVQAYVDYGPGASWEIEQFWPIASGPLARPGDMMDQDVLALADGICSRDDAAPSPLKCIAVAAENQYRVAPDGKQYLDTSSEYENAVFAPAVLELGNHTYCSLGTVKWTKHQSPFASASDPARTVVGKFEYRITMDVSQDEAGNVSVTLLEEFWQAMQDTDPEAFAVGCRGQAAWGYRRFQRYDKGRGLTFLHNLPVPSAPEEWIAKRTK